MHLIVLKDLKFIKDNFWCKCIRSSY